MPSHAFVSVRPSVTDAGVAGFGVGIAILLILPL
jgi:hypothetical protein